VAPTLAAVNVVDSVTLEATFDRPLDPRVPLVAGSARVVSADSTPLTVVAVLTAAEASARRSRADSLARLDSIARAEAAARGDTVPPPARADVLPPAGRASPLHPSVAAPARQVVIRLDSLTPLRAGGIYRVEMRGIRGLLGAVKTSDRVVSAPPSFTPTAREPRQPAAAPADITTRRER
jgi:hypothetical protein